LALVFHSTPARADSHCAQLLNLPLPHAKVTVAELVTGGSFTPPGATAALTGLPDFCRVAVTSTPTKDSIINLEVWIPTNGWNGKYEQLGCGGFCGSIGYSGLATAIQRGYAGAATDDGSQAGGLATFALGHPEKIIDFGYRALKETTDKSKTIITALSGHRPRRSYFAGCSDGGREALMEAQRFPDDFDGIIVGSPANFWTHLFAGFIWNEQALLKDPANYIPSSLLPVLSNAARAECAGQDGGVPTDLFLNDPRDCRFDPGSVQCAPGQDPTTCLSAEQVATARQIYRGPHDPRNGKLIFPGYEPGAEANAANWPAWITGATPGSALQQFFGNGFFADFVFMDPNFDFNDLNFTSDIRFADQEVGGIINSVDPDLRPFRRHGAKMIHYVGWADSAIAPMNSVNYYEDVKARVGGNIRDFYRLYMVPGMAHCAGGDGPNAFGNGVDAPVIDAEHDLLMALDRWVEDGIPPHRIIATHYVDNDPTQGVEFQRPLCPFPEVAFFQGGDSTNADDFRCFSDERDRDPRDQDDPPSHR
jgi:feruloyl esterase